MRRHSIALVGGGRWARVYGRVLSQIPDPVAVTIVSPRNADGMRGWVAAEGLPYQVVSDPDRIACDATIIANAAADHEAAAARFLKAGVPVLVEKPFAMNAAGAAHLIELSQARGVYLAAALVFKFARYLDRFAALLPDWSRIRSISVTWTDPRAESRHGERKSYDPTLSVPADVLPHIVSVLDALFPRRPISCRSVAVERAGAQVDLELDLDGRPCAVRLARNADRRVRLVEVIADGQRLALDFSVEPGRISLDGESRSGDPDWDGQPSPLTRLVQSFLDAVRAQARDDRLDAGLGLLACRLTDQVLPRYDAAVTSWLRQAHERGAVDKDDLAYALAELGMASVGSDRPLDQLAAALRRRAGGR